MGFSFREEATPRRVLYSQYTKEGANLAPIKEEKRLTFHSLKKEQTSQEA
jgi:hypothetical protein